MSLIPILLKGVEKTAEQAVDIAGKRVGISGAGGQVTAFVSLGLGVEVSAMTGITRVSLCADRCRECSGRSGRHRI